MKKQQPAKPKTPREWALYRAKSSCVVGMNMLRDEGALHSERVEFSIFALLNAVEDIAEAMGEGK